MNRANRPRLSRISGSSYASKLLGRAGDGSTLSLDFTTGQLDPRLTFTRDSNATFINSSGLVQWADSNIFYNSTWTDANNTPTAWSAGSGTASRSGETRTFTTSASQVYITQTRNTSSGIRYTASVEVTAVTGTQRIDDVIVALGGSSYQYYFNGSTAGGSTTLTPGVVGVAFTAGAATTTVRVGSGVQGTNTTGAVTLRFPQFEPGSVASRIYRPNDSTTRSYEAPRFDYDPTTLAPKGLLIEGQATSLARYSETLETTGGFWGYNAATRTVESSDVNPTGGTGSISFGPTTNGGSRYCGLFLSGQTTTVAYTYSVWVKAKGTSSLVVSIQNSAGAVNSNARIISQPSGANASFTGSGGGFPQINNLSATGWTRIELTTTATLGGTGALNVFMYPNDTSTQTTADTVYVWGAQLEAGSGASSYIPTGASQGSRAYDHCYATGANFTSWFSVGAGTMVAVSDNIKNNTQNLAATISDDSLNNYVRMGFKVGGAANESMLTTVGGSGSFQGSVDSGYAPPLNTVYRMAYAWDTNNFGIVANGGAVVTDSSGTLAGAGVLTCLVVGGDFVAGPNDIYFKNGHIRSLKYWPYRLPNAQLQSLTT